MELTNNAPMSRFIKICKQIRAKKGQFNQDLYDSSPPIVKNNKNDKSISSFCSDSSDHFNNTENSIYTDTLDQFNVTEKSIHSIELEPVDSHQSCVTLEIERIKLLLLECNEKTRRFIQNQSKLKQIETLQEQCKDHQQFLHLLNQHKFYSKKVDDFNMIRDQLKQRVYELKTKINSLRG
jgi:hypothetical protein